jgi:hypothetical protein
VDKTDSGVSKAMDMAQATWGALNRYAREMCGCADSDKLPSDVAEVIRNFAWSYGGGVIGRNLDTMEDMPSNLEMKRRILGVPRR